MTKQENEDRAGIAAGNIPTRTKRGRKRQAFPPPVTEGQRLLQLTCTTHNLTYEYIQERVGALTPGAVLLWLQGKRRPDGAMRGAIARAFGIEPRTWDQRPSEAPILPPQSASSPPPPPPPPPPPGPPPPPARSTSTLDGCLNMLDDIRIARSDTQLLASERVKLADTELRTLALRARLERDAERTEDRIVREHPEWQRLKRAIIRALAAHPEALRDVCTVLEEPLPQEAPALMEGNGHSG